MLYALNLGEASASAKYFEKRTKAWHIPLLPYVVDEIPNDTTMGVGLAEEEGCGNNGSSGKLHVCLL